MGNEPSADVTLVLDARAELGECPTWAAEEEALYWVDIRGAALHRFHPGSGADRVWPLPSRCGSFALRAGGGAVVALAAGLYTLDFDTGAVTPLVSVALPEGVRFNDGKVSPDGRFFVGTMDEATMREPVGVLYRLDPDHTLHEVLDGLVISNGLAWTADGATLYHADTGVPAVWTYAYDAATGAIGDRRVFASPDAEGRPDGAATDVEGGYWSAGVTAGMLNRFTADGKLDRSIPLPVARPTMPCFGGPDLRTLYVTSLRYDAPAEDLARLPATGGIVALRVDVPGVPVARYAG